ncbi:hypothetical protein A2U01_0038675 [Trifolium medium]|uniref:Uncharacterized protein n=1 Tax=Trifolium medium TaxID=97028 RepID=A0A392Q0M8_9FABA|nr:hypothetical protein [Trifolium medium]
MWSAGIAAAAVRLVIFDGELHGDGGDVVVRRRF